MTLQSQRRSRKRQHNIDRALQVVVLGLTGLALGAAMVALPGCATSSRTRVDPAVTSATQQTRTERAGRTKTTTTKLEIVPAASPPDAGQIRFESQQPAQPGSLSHVESPYGGGGVCGVHASLTPAAWTTRLAHMPGENSVNGVSHHAPFTLVGYRPEQAQSPIERAIEQAARNGSTVRYEVTQHEDIPLTADTANATLSDSGPGLATSSDEAAIGFDGRKGGARLPWGGTSGKTSFGLDAKLVSAGVNALHIIGAIVMLGAVIPLWSPPRRWVAAGSIAGVGLLIVAAGTVSEQAPWVFVLAILAFLGLAIWQGYEMWRNKSRKVAIDSIVKGVENADGTSSKIAKGYIAKAAGENLPVVKRETTAAKKKLTRIHPD